MKQTTPTPRLTLQQIFDLSSRHMLAQGKRAQTDPSECRYRAYDETTGQMLMCAVGCLIPENAYDPRIEGASVPAIPLDWTATNHRFHLRPVLEASGIDTSDHDTVSLLCMLQRVHDGAKPERWREELAHTAKRFGLKYEWTFSEEEKEA